MGCNHSIMLFIRVPRPLAASNADAAFLTASGFAALSCVASLRIRYLDAIATMQPRRPPAVESKATSGGVSEA